jgi:tRNA 2-selenouridine synthase
MHYRQPMALRFGTLQEFLAHGFDSVIDVRSPSEYAEDHVPGAISLPVFSDAERARVGTVYKQVSPFEARKLGAAILARNAARHIEGALAQRPGGWRPLVYCWRGGQRSAAFATILGQIGWRVEVVEGGYKSYRAEVQRFLYQARWPGRVVLLDGNTGTGKTALLDRLAARGVQVIDLEGLANHRGSLFGATGPQPAQKGFESALAFRLSLCDPGRPLVVEAESSKIGQRIIPPALWQPMQVAPRLEVSAPVSARVAFLLEAYADIVEDRARLEEIVAALHRLQGGERVARWQAMIASGDLAGLAEELITCHYDPRYTRQRGAAEIHRSFHAERLDAAGLDVLADRLAAAVAAL